MGKFYKLKQILLDTHIIGKDGNKYQVNLS